ncbi:MAG: hypothetical protein IJY81_04445 [Lachnospiraceae bacterium]|nr:hypothetical protein [Lachnospiraceae bacterium]
MKKIPTLFVREFENGKIKKVLDIVTDGCEEAFFYGDAKIKLDGSCCAIIDGEFYKRFDAKHGKPIPEGAIPCGEPDPVTGHHPHWIRVDENKSADKWHVLAYHFSSQHSQLVDGTYEIIGKHFQNNPYQLENDELIRHEDIPSVQVERSFDAIRDWLMKHNVEGLVFWHKGAPVCKIKRSDFGFEWNNYYCKHCKL